MRTKEQILKSTTDLGMAAQSAIELLADIRDQLAYFNDNVVRPQGDDRDGAIYVKVQQPPAS